MNNVNLSDLTLGSVEALASENPTISCSRTCEYEGLYWIS
jgi:hypothetical protein